MQQEIEVKFLHTDHEVIRSKLQKLGGKCTQPLQQMRRAVMDFPDKRLQEAAEVWSWIRIRDEGKQVTVTYKQISKDGKHTTHEIEYVASSYEDAVKVFEAVGLKLFSEQETRREVWKLDDVEIMLDEWPWLDPFIEIEGKTEAAIKRTATELGLKWKDAVHGSADVVYATVYPGIKPEESVAEIPSLRFSEFPDWLEQRKHV